MLASGIGFSRHRENAKLLFLVQAPYRQLVEVVVGEG
ncbi:MAG: hypothetical protein ACJAYX_001896 [Planctomycetota bacterium]|jgi:hypothetical protein